ncbi:MAG: hypothetical protein HYY51_01280 [Candidatus Magasanikbacteria bacterium]|nr:hypothetical protein [Candidatus Magasanikbacteria bacterium]
MKHRDGGKYGGSHTTITEDACAVLDAAADMPEVIKIVLKAIGNDRRRAGSPLRVKCVPVPHTACLRVAIVKGGTSQEAFVYVDQVLSLAIVASRLESFTDSKAGKRGKRVRGRRKGYRVPPREIKE